MEPRKDITIGEMIDFFGSEGDMHVAIADEEGIELVTADKLQRTTAHQKMDGYGGRENVICRRLIPRGHRPWHAMEDTYDVDLHEEVDMVPCGETKIRDLTLENNKVVWVGTHYYCPICEASG